MTINDIITNRRTIKSFKPDPIPEKEVLGWLEAASYAPNHKMNEPWELLFIGPETRAKLNHKADFFGAPVVFAVLSQPGATPFQRDENLIAVSCFVQNLLLSAHEAGAGSFWSSLGASAQSREIMGVPDDYDVVGVIAVGYPEEVPAPKPRTPIASKIKHLS